MPENSLDSLHEFLKLGHHLTNPLNPKANYTGQKVNRVSSQPPVYHWCDHSFYSAEGRVERRLQTHPWKQGATFCRYHKRNSNWSQWQRLIQLAQHLLSRRLLSSTCAAYIIGKVDTLWLPSNAVVLQLTGSFPSAIKSHYSMSRESRGRLWNVLSWKTISHRHLWVIPHWLAY